VSGKSPGFTSNRRCVEWSLRSSRNAPSITSRSASALRFLRRTAASEHAPMDLALSDGWLPVVLNPREARAWSSRRHRQSRSCVSQQVGSDPQGCAHRALIDRLSRIVLAKVQ